MKTLEDAKKEGVLENTIYNADCLDILRLMPDKSVDLVLTDPPYGINVGGGGGKLRLESPQSHLIKVGGVSPLVKVGIQGLSNPKSIGDLMTAKSP